MCVCVCVRACVRACVCVWVCVSSLFNFIKYKTYCKQTVEILIRNRVIPRVFSNAHIWA